MPKLLFKYVVISDKLRFFLPSQHLFSSTTCFCACLAYSVIISLWFLSLQEYQSVAHSSLLEASGLMLFIPAFHMADAQAVQENIPALCFRTYPFLSLILTPLSDLYIMSMMTPTLLHFSHFPSPHSSLL